MARYCAHKGKSQTQKGARMAAKIQLHPVQAAFIELNAMQCGYCTTGMIMSGVALLAEKPRPTREEIVQGMNGNICRCCTYPRIIAAIEQAAEMSKGGAR